MTKTTDKHKGQTDGGDDLAALNKPSALSLSIDYDYFRSFLEETELTDQEKLEFIEAMAQIMMNFVSLGFDIHPMQLAGIDGDEIEEKLENDITSLVSYQSPKTVLQNKPHSLELNAESKEETVNAIPN